MIDEHLDKAQDFLRFLTEQSWLKSTHRFNALFHGLNVSFR